MTMYRVYYHHDAARVTDAAELVGVYRTEREARKALRNAVGVSRCDDSFVPACASGEVVTGADGGDETSGPFGWVEIED